MNCPVCNVELKMTDRAGVEIDYCPKCRGVWLDRGELDKIIERASNAEFESPQRDKYDERDRERRYDEQRRKYEDKDRYYDKSGHYTEPHKKHKKRESFLSDLFDF